MEFIVPTVTGLLGILLGRYWIMLDRHVIRDKEVFNNLIRILPLVDGGLEHLRDRDLGTRPYSTERISDLYDFVENIYRPDFIFINRKLEKKKRELGGEVENLLLALQRETFGYSDNPSHKRLPSRESFPDPKDWQTVSDLLNKSSKRVYSLYKDWYTTATRNL